MLDPTKPVRIVVTFDRALDITRTDTNEYWETHDPDTVHALPGEFLKWAVLRPLTWDEVTAVRAAPLGARNSHAFMIGCIAIENHPRAGETFEPRRKVRREDGSSMSAWTPAELARIQYTLGRNFVEEVGAVINGLADSGNGWSGSASYTLPLSSAHELAQTAHRLAARMMKIDGIASSAKSASDSTTTPPENSDAGTPAPATEATSAPVAPG